MKHRKNNLNKDNTFWYSDTPDPMRTHSKMKMWKQLKPLYVDKISIFEARGHIKSTKSLLNVNVFVRIQSFNRLFIAKNIQSGKTTSRSATPLGDGRGVPKCFENFGRFSLRPIRVIKTYVPKRPSPLLAGFALRRRSTISVLTSYNKRKSVSISLIKKGEKTIVTVILADVTKMDLRDPSPVMSLLELIEDANFDIAPGEDLDPGMPDISSYEIGLFLQELGELPSPPLCSHHNDASSVDSSDIPPVESPPDPSPAFHIPAGPAQDTLLLRQLGPNTFEVILPQSHITLADPVVPSLSLAGPMVPSLSLAGPMVPSLSLADPMMPSLSLVGPVVSSLSLAGPVVSNHNLTGPVQPSLAFAGPLVPSLSSPEDLGYGSSPPSSPSPSTSSQSSFSVLSSASTSSPNSVSFPSSSTSTSFSISTSSASTSSSTSTFHITPEETKEERRLREQREACKRYRQNKKKKLGGDEELVEVLQRKKTENEMKVRVMEEMLARMKEQVFVIVTGKRKREEDSEDREGKVSRH